LGKDPAEGGDGGAKRIQDRKKEIWIISTGQAMACEEQVHVERGNPLEGLEGLLPVEKPFRGVLRMVVDPPRSVCTRGEAESDGLGNGVRERLPGLVLTHFEEPHGEGEGDSVAHGPRQLCPRACGVKIDQVGICWLRWRLRWWLCCVCSRAPHLLATTHHIRHGPDVEKRVPV